MAQEVAGTWIGPTGSHDIYKSGGGIVGGKGYQGVAYLLVSA